MDRRILDRGYRDERGREHERNQDRERGHHDPRAGGAGLAFAASRQTNSSNSNADAPGKPYGSRGGTPVGRSPPVLAGDTDGPKVMDTAGTIVQDPRSRAGGRGRESGVSLAA